MSQITKLSQPTRGYVFIAAFVVAWLGMALTSEAILQLMK